MIAISVGSLITFVARITPLVVKGALWALAFEEELEKLSITFIMIQSFLTDINEEQLDLKAVQIWIGHLKDAVYDTEDLLARLETGLKQNQSRVSRSFFRTRVQRSIRKLNGRFNHIRKCADCIRNSEQFFGRVVRTDSGPSPHQLLPTSQIDMSRVVGREDDTKRIVDMLLDSNYDDQDIPVIQIVGMAGMGKTTLAQLVYHDTKIVERFKDNRIWVSVTVNFDLSRILREINPHEVNHANSSHSKLHEDFQKFIGGRCFLLVLDDVWTDNDEKWKTLLFLLKEAKKESRILVTSQKAGLVPNPYDLNLLSEQECSSLFQRVAFGEGHSFPPDLEESGKEIVRKCQKLPLAVKAMGAFLRRNRDPRKWRRVSELGLSEAEKRGSRSERPSILPALKVSYYHLPSYLKPLFCYCSMFPRGYLFDKKELVQLWIAEGLIEFQEQEIAEEIAGQHFNELVIRFFFQTSNVYRERYVMHDLFLELAQSISGHYSCLVEDNRQYNLSKRTHHVSLVCEDMEQPLLDMIHKSKKVRTLLFPSDSLKAVFSQAFNKGLGRMKYIRVLDLSSSTILEVPKSIRKLKLLRYLNLSKTGITRLPAFLCKLYSLQTLLLSGCASLSKLPKDFSKLINLRHLELDEEFWSSTKKLPPRIGNLTSLHNLHAFPIWGEAGYGIEELKGMAYLTGTLHISKLENAVKTEDAKLNKKENIDKLVLEWGSEVSVEEEVKVLEGLQPHPDLKKLKISRFTGTTLPFWMTNGQLRNLVSVSLEYHTRCEVLSLGNLPRLEKLKIRKMNELKELKQEESGSYASLTLLKISDCPNLTKLPSNFPKLEDLDISDCPKLEALPQESMPKKVEIRGCKSLRALPDSNFSERLQHLLIHECEDETLVGGIPNTSSLKSLVLSNIANVTTWPPLDGLESLHILDCNGLVSFQSFFTSLKFLSIQRCSQLETLPDKGLPTTLECLTLGSCLNLQSLGRDDMLKSLTSLKDLYIKDCPKLQPLPKEGFSETLQHLVIERCTLLKERWTEEDWQMIKNIPDREIDFIGESSSS